MAEIKPVASSRNRRLQRRFPLLADSGSRLSFRFPSKGGEPLEASVRDISLSGVSIVLPCTLAGLAVGDVIAGVDACVAEKSFRGDLLVMHVSPQNEPGAICGGLFYPETDEDLITIRLIVRQLESAS